jgi:hypothetical protein
MLISIQEKPKFTDMYLLPDNINSSVEQAGLMVQIFGIRRSCIFRNLSQLEYGIITATTAMQ